MANPATAPRHDLRLPTTFPKKQSRHHQPSHSTASRLRCGADSIILKHQSNKRQRALFPLAIFQSRMFSFLASGMNMYVLACSAYNMCVHRTVAGSLDTTSLPAVETGRFTLFRYTAVARARGREAHGCFHGPCGALCGVIEFCIRCLCVIATLADTHRKNEAYAM